MKKEKIIQIIIILAVVGVLGVAGYFGVREIKKALKDESPKSMSEQSESNSANDSGNVQGGEKQTYTHPDYGFTLKYPGNYTLGKFPEGEGEVILVQSSGAGGKTEGFQIFISSYEEEEPLSFAVIKKAAPEMTVKDEKEIALGEEGIVAYSFNNQGESGDTHEVWFEVDGNLYQCTSFKDFGGKMEEILGSLSFN